MSDKFFEYIANILISYFQNNEFQGGERYCLKMGSSENVERMNAKLSEKTKSFSEDFEINTLEYKTYSMEFNRGSTSQYSVIVVPKIDEMTDDFMTTMRNYALDRQDNDSRKKIMLMIADNPIDSITSGTSDLQKKGQPFFIDNFIDKIKLDIDNDNFDLNYAKKRLLSVLLNKRQHEKESGESIYDYSIIIDILTDENSRITEEQFTKLRMLPIKGFQDKKNKKEIDGIIEEDLEAFQEIDKQFHFGRIDKLSNKYNETIIRLLNRRKIKGIEWFREKIKNKETGEDVFEYLYFDKLKDKCIPKASRKEQPEFKDELITIKASGKELTRQKDYYVKNKSQTKAGKRSKSILVMVPDDADKIEVSISSTLGLLKGKNNVSSFEVSMDRENVKHPGVTFCKKSFKDQYKLNYELKLCLVSVPSGYFENIKPYYDIDIKQESIVLMLVNNEKISFGKRKEESDGQEIYEINLSEYPDNDINTSFDKKIIIDVSSVEEDIAYTLTLEAENKRVVVPLKVKVVPRKVNYIDGLQLLCEKYSNDNRDSFHLNGSKIIIGSQEYYVQNEFKKSLELEKAFIIDGPKYAIKLISEGSDPKSINAIDIELPEEIREAYSNLIDAYKKENTLPSLAYYKDNILGEMAEKLITEVINYFESLKPDDRLDDEAQGVLSLGCVFAKNGKLLMSPLHPLNIAYQLKLSKEKFDGLLAHQELLEKLTPLNLIPYVTGLGDDKKEHTYRTFEQKHSPEWRFYADSISHKHSGSGNFVPGLIADKIHQYRKHFSFLFDTVKSVSFPINLVHMGDCSSVLHGITDYFTRKLSDSRENINRIPTFHISCYGELESVNSFEILEDSKSLMAFINDYKSRLDPDVKADLYQLLSTHIRFYNKGNSKDYAYAHLTFYEMPKDMVDYGISTINDNNTGVSLGGFVSGIPSVFIRDRYQTGFGLKNSKPNELLKLASLYNSVYLTAYNGNPYNSQHCICTQIDSKKDDRLNEIYDKSNWVVFISPQVDLSYFNNSSDLMIIHYSDQYTTTAGYDDITVTNKSDEYSKIIKDYLMDKLSQRYENSYVNEKVKDVIRYFNAINGNWLLRLISTKSGSNFSASTFSREKMSIISAIRVCKEYFNFDEETAWVPLSLEELLRVSGGAGYSQKEGILSAYNLGFRRGSKSDDLLMVGVRKVDDAIQIYLTPVEVKIGKIDINVVVKAHEQVNTTAEDFVNAVNAQDSLRVKLVRNFFMQHLIVSCEKLQMYGLLDEKCKRIIEDWRADLLNNNYTFVQNDEYTCPTIILFHQEVATRPTFSDGTRVLNFSEKQGYEFMIATNEEIKNAVNQDYEEELEPQQSLEQKEIQNSYVNRELKVSTNIEAKSTEPLEDITCPSNTPENAFEDSPISEKDLAMRIKFGESVNSKAPIYWLPNDTRQVMHTNTGIIGVMGTGKTQFNKSLIAQLVSEQKKAYDNENFGFLIFDYKGDYNENHKDFIQATNANVLKPYHLPFNPLSLIKPRSFKPLLPVHTAEVFKCTLSKIYGLGPKQQQTLKSCILEAYHKLGIREGDVSTWNLTAPTLKDVYEIYMADEEIKKNDSLFTALSDLMDFQLFESDSKQTVSLYDVMKGVVVLDMAGYPESIQNLIVAISLDLLNSQMLSVGSSNFEHPYRQLTKMVLVDEADNFMSKEFDSLKKIMQTGREFGVGVVLSTQSLKHFNTTSTDYSSFIETWVVHRVTDLKPTDISSIFDSPNKTDENVSLLEYIKNQTVHQSVVKISKANPIYIKDYPFWQYLQRND